MFGSFFAIILLHQALTSTLIPISSSIPINLIFIKTKVINIFDFSPFFPQEILTKKPRKKINPTFVVFTAKNDNFKDIVLFMVNFNGFYGIFFFQNEILKGIPGTKRGKIEKIYNFYFN